MKYLSTRDTNHFVGLTLADGSNWNIIPSDNHAYDVVFALAKVMQLQPQYKASKNAPKDDTFRRLLVQVEGRIKDQTQLYPTVHIKVEDEEKIIVCTMNSGGNGDIPASPLVHLSRIICRDAHHRGGILLHGALAEWNGSGVILAGPGGRGKSSASHRLPHHWHSFCDDTTLVVRDSKGVYWAHPWPTWSAFMFKGSGGTWDVQHSVLLKGIFFLEQSHKDEFEPIGAAQSVCLLNESSEQIQCFISGHSKKKELRRFRLLRFDNICALAQTVPSYVLRLGLNGAFWQEIEAALKG